MFVIVGDGDAKREAFISHDATLPPEHDAAQLGGILPQLFRDNEAWGMYRELAHLQSATMRCPPPQIQTAASPVS